MDPTAIAGLVGGLGGLFGGGQKESQLDKLYKKFSHIFDVQMGNYNRTNYQAQDREAEDTMRGVYEHDSQNAVKNYFGHLGVSGVAGLSDTDRAAMASSMSAAKLRPLAELHNSLLLSRNQRMKSDMPSMGELAGGFNAANQVDNVGRDNNDRMMKGLFGLAGMFGKKKPAQQLGGGYASSAPTYSGGYVPPAYAGDATQGYTDAWGDMGG